MTFELIVQRLSPTLKKITRKLNGHHSFFDDDDLYQEALIHLWGTYKKGIIVDKTDSYILQGCYYHLRNYLRTVHDKASFLSLNDPAGEDGRSLEEMISSSDMTVLTYLESKLQTEAVMGRISFTEREY